MLWVEGRGLFRCIGQFFSQTNRHLRWQRLQRCNCFCFSVDAYRNIQILRSWWVLLFWYNHCVRHRSDSQQWPSKCCHCSNFLTFNNFLFVSSTQNNLYWTLLHHSGRPCSSLLLSELLHSDRSSVWERKVRKSELLLNRSTAIIFNLCVWSCPHWGYINSNFLA